MATNNTTAAARADIEAARNLKIYNELAKIARVVFDHINAETGKIYTPADIARAITGGPVVTCINGLNYRCDRIEKYEIGSGLTFADGYDPATAYDVEVDGFSCRVIGWKIFEVLDRAARSWDIATAARVTFEKPYETAARVVSFSLSTTAARELASCCGDDVLRPVMSGVHLDTRRRCLVASDGKIMRVFQLGAALTVDETAAASSYIIPAAVLKSGRVVTIDANGIASTDKKSAPCIAGRFPNWPSVIPAANEAGRVAITPAQWKQLKKAVADVAKVHPGGKYSCRRVIIAHETASDKLKVYAFDGDFNRERENVVSIDTAAPAFSISFRAEDFARIAGTPSALYVKDHSRAIVTTDAAGLSLVMPMLQTGDDKYYIYFNFADGAADLLPGIDIPAAAAELKEEYEAAAAAEIVAKVREECKGKSAAKILKYMDDNFGWSSALQRARAIIKKEIEREKNAAAPAADPVAEAITDTPTAAETPAETIDTPQADTLAPVTAEALTIDPDTGHPVALTPADHLTPAEILAEVAAERHRRELEKVGEIVVAEAETLAATWPGLSRAEILAELLTATPEHVADLLAEWVAPGAFTDPVGHLFTPIAVADTITIETPAEVAEVETPAAPAADLTADELAERRRARRRERDLARRAAKRAAAAAEVATADPVAETITDTPQADTIETPQADETPDPVSVWALADELPTADGLTADTVTPADLLAPVFVAVSVAEVADPADTPQADREADTDRENAPQADETPRALLLTIAHRARRWAVAVAAAVAALLLLTLTPDRPAVSVAAPAADLLAPVADTLTAADRETITDETPADLLADTLTRETAAAPVFEAVSVAETAAPAADRPAPRKRAHRPRKRPALLLAPDTLTREAVAADTLAPVALLTIETPDTLTADTIEADTLAPVADVIRAEVADTLTADTLTRETIETPDTIAAPQVAPDTIETADTLTAAPQVAPDTIDETADPVADELAPVAPAADLLTPAEVADTIDTPQADPLAVVATAGTPSPYVIACKIIHPFSAAPAAGPVIGSAPNHWAALTL